MDVGRTLRNAVAGCVLATLPSLSAGQAHHSSYDPATQQQSAKPPDGFVDFSLKRINSSDRDFGQCLDKGRAVLLDETMKNGYFWSNVVALGLMGCLFIIIVYQHRVQTVRDWTAAEMLGQYEHRLAQSNAQLDQATKQNQGFMKAVAELRESALRSQSSTGAPDQAPPRPVRDRAVGVQAKPPAAPKNGAGKPATEHGVAVATATDAGSQIGLFKAEVDLVAKVNALEQQLSRSGELEKLLRRQLNEAGRKLQAEQEKNRTLKGE